MPANSSSNPLGDLGERVSTAGAQERVHGSGPKGHAEAGFLPGKLDQDEKPQEEANEDKDETEEANDNSHRSVMQKEVRSNCG